MRKVVNIFVLVAVVALAGLSMARMEDGTYCTVIDGNIFCLDERP